MERFIHYLTYGTRVTIHDPVVIFREQEWATRARDLAQVEWFVRERGESEFCFSAFSIYLLKNVLLLLYVIVAFRFDPKGRRQW